MPALGPRQASEPRARWVWGRELAAPACHRHDGRGRSFTKRCSIMRQLEGTRTDDAPDGAARQTIALEFHQFSQYLGYIVP